MTHSLILGDVESSPSIDLEAQHYSEESLTPRDWRGRQVLNMPVSARTCDMNKIGPSVGYDAILMLSFAVGMTILLANLDNGHNETIGGYLAFNSACMIADRSGSNTSLLCGLKVIENRPVNEKLNRIFNTCFIASMFVGAAIFTYGTMLPEDRQALDVFTGMSIAMQSYVAFIERNYFRQ
ncbi:MAG: hypothetical protein JHC93_03680 [Parachlamydiales bacterium]|nr:hypothetical protein [Parachlamydiales bacterium]